VALKEFAPSSELVPCAAESVTVKPIVDAVEQYDHGAVAHQRMVQAKAR
jgi:hypothetical protein